MRGKKICVLLALWLFAFFCNVQAGLAQGAGGNNDSAQTLYDRGMQKFGAGDFVEAVRWFTRAVRSDSSLVMAYMNRGHAKTKMHDFRGAIEDYNRVIK